MASDEGGLVGVEVVYCPRPGVTDSTRLQLAATATVAVALQASGVLQRHGLDATLLRVGVWNHAREAGSALRHGDRVEIYRPLTVDPKEARRLRYKRHREAAKVTQATQAPKA